MPLTPYQDISASSRFDCCLGEQMSGKFTLLAAAMCVLLATPARGEPDELILQCKGRVGSFMPMSWAKDDELIAVHIKEGKITVSGNDFLLGQNIRLCPPVTLGIPSHTTDRIGITGRFMCTKI